MADINKINSKIEQLKESALFYLFVSSKELFHSNFWFWLSTLNSIETAKLFIDDLILENDIYFERESYISHKKIKAKCDIIIKKKDTNIIVIENKLKDIAKVEQLERIKQSSKDICTKFILTTLFQNEEQIFNGWIIRTYEAIEKKIDPKKFTMDLFYRKLITKYKDLVKELIEFASLLNCTNNYDFAIAFDKDLFNSLNKIKFWETYQKYRASHLISEFHKKFTIDADYSINNQKATMSFFMPLNEEYNFGIQIENNQYRKFIFHKNKGNAETLANKLCESNIFFDSKLTFRDKRKFLKYGINFKYQYEKIELISFDKLFERISKDINWIKSNSDRIENIFCH